MSDPHRRLHMVGNAHLDPVWLWQWPEGYAEVRATFRSALDRMAEYPEFRYSQGSVAYYAWLEEADPEAFEEVRRRVEEGRWELVAGWWVEPDCNLPGGESLARQALVGQRWLVDRFGRAATVAANIDPFGHPASLPRILHGSGLDAYVFLRPGPHEMTLPPVFWWEASDGSRVLGVRVPNEYCAPGGDIGGHIDKVVAQLPAGWEDGLCLYGVGNHGGGPTRANIESIRRLDATDQVPSLVFSTLGRFVASQVGRDDLSVIRGELQHHAVGCYSAHSGIKRWVRRTEAGLLAAERISAFGDWVGGRAYPQDELARAWRSLLSNEFHDILAGTSVEAAYDDARDELGEAAAIASRASNAAIQALARRVEIPHEDGTNPILVANTHPWPVRAAIEVEVFRLLDGFAIEDEAGRDVPVQATRSSASTLGGRQRIVFAADLPALGYRVFRLRPSGGRGRPFLAWTAAAAAQPVSGPDPVVLDNDIVHLELDPSSGAIRRLVDVASGATIIDGGGEPSSRAVVYDDPSDTWSHRVLSYRRAIGAFETERVAILESGPVRTVVRVDSRFGGSRLSEDFVVTRTVPGIEVRVTLDWRERARLLKLRFHVAVTRPVATHEIAFGTIERPNDGTEFPIQGWIDVSGRLAGGSVGGLAVVNEGKPGVDVRGAEIGMTVVRSPAYAHHEPAPLPEDDRAVWHDQGIQRFRYGLVAHAGAAPVADLARAAAAFAFGPVALLESAHAGILPAIGSFLAIEPPSVVVTAVKRAEDAADDLVVRLLETAGAATTGRLRVGLGGREVPFTIDAYALRTLRIGRDPAGPVVEVNLVEWPVEAGTADEPERVDEALAAPRAAARRGRMRE